MSHCPTSGSHSREVLVCRLAEMLPHGLYEIQAAVQRMELDLMTVIAVV